MAQPPVRAYWVRIPARGDVSVGWVWRPVTEPEPGDLDLLSQLRAKHWQPLVSEQEPLSTAILWGQLAEVREIRLPGRLVPQLWTKREQLAHSEAMPVALAFALPGAPPRPLAEAEHVLHMAEALPPPQIGEMALVAGPHTWTSYSIERLGAAGQAVQQQIQNLLLLRTHRGAATSLSQLYQHVQPLAQQLAKLYWDYHQEAKRDLKGRVPALPTLTSKHHTRMPSTNSFRALAQSFGPSVQQTLWSREGEGVLQLVTPNGSLLSVQGTNDSESAALHHYVMEMLGPEGLKHMIGLLDAYYIQTGGKDRKLDARISLEDFLDRLGKGGKARDREEQSKFMHTILYLASSYITSDERRALPPTRTALPYGRQRRSRKQIERKDYSPLLVIERLGPGPDGGITIPSQVEFHLGAEFFEALFGAQQQFFSVPTAQLLSYHAVREQQELMLGVYLCNLLVIGGGRCTIDFTTLLLQSALQTLSNLMEGENRTRDALRVLYALEHLEQDGLLVRAPHEEIDLVLAIEWTTGACTTKHLAAATQTRVEGAPYPILLQGMAPEALRRKRRTALQTLLDRASDVAPLAFEAGPLLQEQAKKRAAQRKAALERSEQRQALPLQQQVVEAFKPARENPPTDGMERR